MWNCWPSINRQSLSITKLSKAAETTALRRRRKRLRSDLKVFSLADLRRATRNFRPDTCSGKGGFGTIFEGWIDEITYAPSQVGVGMAVAVRRNDWPSDQKAKEWEADVEFLGKFNHPNLVKLLGYCCEDGVLICLVYEYMQKGSLENHLFRKFIKPLPWDIRLKIAVGAARGLAFLHTTEKQVIYRNFKTSDILLAEDFTAKLSDFGLVKPIPIYSSSHVKGRVVVGTYGYVLPDHMETIDGNQDVTARVFGSRGYAAPEFVANGHLCVKSDVYGFGVMLLELLTGQRVIDSVRPAGEHNLVEWATPFLPDKRKFKKIMDPNLEDQYPERAAYKITRIILKCLKSDPKNRPSMEEVLQALVLINAIN